MFSTDFTWKLDSFTTQIKIFRNEVADMFLDESLNYFQIHEERRKLILPTYFLTKSLFEDPGIQNIFTEFWEFYVVQFFRYFLEPSNGFYLGDFRAETWKCFVLIQGLSTRGREAIDRVVFWYSRCF